MQTAAGGISCGSMKKDEYIVYPPEAGPQAAYQKVTVPRQPEGPPPRANGPIRFGWVMLFLGGLFWGALVWMYGRGTDFMDYTAPLKVFGAAPDYCLPVLYGAGGLVVFSAVLAMVRGSFLRGLFLLVAGPVMVALCLACGTFFRIQFGPISIPGMPPAAVEKQADGKRAS